MPRNIEDIITPKSRRTIRNIPVPPGRRRVERVEAAEPVPLKKVEAVRPPRAAVEEISLPRIKTPLHRERTHSDWRGKRMGVAALVAILILGFAIFSVFGSATLAYTPKSAPLSFQNESYSAYKTGGGGILLFSVVKISATKGLPVSASGEVDVERKASGTIIVYNNQSSQPQRLVKTTRFETPDGKIYRTPTDVSVPGRTSAGPGSIEITVEADRPGEAYNIGLSDFTIPGFKGDPRFETIYARSKSPMSGGFVGKEKRVSDEELSRARPNLEAALKEELLASAAAQVPADFVLFPSLSKIDYEVLPQSNTTDTSVQINERGDFYGVIFKRSDLANYLKGKKLAATETQVVSIPDLESLTFTFSGEPPSDLLMSNQISFTVSGTATAVWQTDKENLKKDLSGRKKGELTAVLANHPGILSADAMIWPFWETSFPEDPMEIKIKELPIKN